MVAKPVFTPVMSTAEVTTVIVPSVSTRGRPLPPARCRLASSRPDSDPSPWERVFVAQELVRGRRLQDLDRSEGRHGPRHAAVALDAGVLEAELDRVEAELGGQLVEQRLDGKGSGRAPGPR